MNQQKDVFMTLLTGVGMFVGIITYFVCSLIIKKYTQIAAFSIFGFAIVFRFIGYLIDKMLAKRD